MTYLPWAVKSQRKIAQQKQRRQQQEKQKKVVKKENNILSQKELSQIEQKLSQKIVNKQNQRLNTILVKNNLQSMMQPKNTGNPAKNLFNTIHNRRVQQRQSQEIQKNLEEFKNSFNYKQGKGQFNGFEKASSSVYPNKKGNQEVKHNNNNNTNRVDHYKKNDKLTAAQRQQQAYIQRIQSEIIENVSKISWDDIAGLQFAKKAVQQAIIWPIKRPGLFKGNRMPPKGVLLFGPPGTGKTTIARAIASQSKATFFSISASTLLSKWIGESEKLTRALFDLAQKRQPSVIFIDEIDSLLTSRDGPSSSQGGSSGSVGNSRGVKTQFLLRMQGVDSNPQDRIVIVGATNRPQDLDKAIIRRFTKRLYIPLPCINGRQHYIQKAMMREDKHNMLLKDIQNLAELTDGYSCSDLSALVSEAAMEPIRGLTEKQMIEIDEDNIRGVNLQDFVKMMKIIKPSVKVDDLEEYVKWNGEYGSDV